MSNVRKFEDLEVWQMARVFCARVYEICETGTLARDFGLRNQIRRSSGSVMDNIAEGFERNGNREFIQYLYIAKASAGEVRSQLYRIEDAKHLSPEITEQLRSEIISISKKLSTMIQYLQKSAMTGTKYRDRKIT